MHLKKLKIQGFKSFADRVALNFNAGMTAIVGPNGCGKSNISDAFRWVMGEQSAKSMRGGKMQDVIFNGAASRKPLNMAEVTLTFADVQGALPVDFEEVEITRRLHRSGESDYFINGHQVRLKDIQSMLWGSGVGHGAFSIFEQGKIDQVIQYSPTERIAIFVEAAGIVRFLHRKKETLKKLQEVDLNLSRINDIHQEVEKRINQLTEQAEKALHFKDVKGQLIELDKAVLVTKLGALQAKHQQSSQNKERLQIEIQEKNQILSVLDQQRNELKERIVGLEKQLLSKNEELFKIRGTKQLKDQEKKNHLERKQEALEKEKQAQRELEDIAEQKKKLTHESQAIDNEIKNFQLQKNAADKRLKDVQKEFQNLEKDVGQLREQQLRTQHERLKLTQLESQIESELKQRAVRQEHLQERLEALNEKKHKIEESIGNGVRQVEEKRNIMKAIEMAVDNQRKALQHLDYQLNEQTQEVEALQKKCDNLQKDLTEQRARQKILLKLKEEMQGFSSGAKYLAQEAQKDKSPLFGKLKPLYECLVPQPGAEEALATVMKPYMQTLVVGSKKDFEEVLSFAQAQKLSDFSLLCLAHLEDILPTSAPKDSIALKDLILQHPLTGHFLSKSYITDQLSQALEAVHAVAGAEIWTRQGTFVDRNRVIFYLGKSEQNIFTREAELKTLEKGIKKQEGDLRRLEDLLQEIKCKRVEMQTQRTETDKNIRKEEMKLVEANFGLQKSNSDLERLRSEIAQIDKEMENVKQSQMQQADSMTALNKKHQSAKNQLSDVQQQAQTAENQLESQLALLKEKRQNLQVEESGFQKITDELNKRLHALNLLEMKTQENQKRETRLKSDLEHAQNVQSTLQNRSTQDQEDLVQIEQLLKVAAQDCQEQEKDLQQSKAKSQEIENKLQQVRTEIKEKENKENSLNVQLAQNETTKQSLDQELVERHQLTLQEAFNLGVSLTIPLEQAEKRLKQMRNEVESSGDINFAAIEELEKHQERSRFFDQEVKDMNGAKHELLSIIADLDNQSRAMFYKTFEEIRGHFQKNFKILFEGGEADLELIEAEDILEAGIEISAKPPGKQMRSIQLLSGGEKCLTAMALLFAIFEVKPSPFCILDEIDAPLDDSNVERFARIVQKYADRCQFIVITHNKRTMAIADTLFGVSMEEKGVSKVLTLTFAEQQAPMVSVVV